MNIAVIMTCHNRREKTLMCLHHLFQQNLSKNQHLKVYLLDDCSVDGTAEAIHQNYPDIHLLRGDGTFFWNRGMYTAWQEALKDNYDYYLWLNDDTFLRPDALSCLLKTHQELITSAYSDSIIVGSTQDADTKVFTYGGIIRPYAWHPLKFSPVPPEDTPVACEAMNGNCVLIPQSVAFKVGNLDPQFSHSLGDFDYGLRSRKKRCTVWIAPGYFGTCSLNSTQGTWQDTDLSLMNRFQNIVEPKGLPWREWKCFSQRHGGLFGFIFFLLPYIKVFISRFMKI
jgi:GT2 family glycosyltransferase